MARNDDSAKLVVDEKMANIVKSLKEDLAITSKSTKEIMDNLRAAFDPKFIKDATDVWLGVQEKILSTTERQYAEIQELSKAYHRITDEVRQEKHLHETIAAQAKAKHTFQAQQLAHLVRIKAINDDEVKTLGKTSDIQEEKLKILEDQEKIHIKIAEFSDKAVQLNEKLLEELKKQGIELHNQETAKARILKLEEKVEGVAQHIARTFFGINGHVDTMGSGMAFFLAKLSQGDQNAGRIFPSIAEKLTKQYLTLPNLMISFQQKGEELLANSIRMNLGYYNNQQRMFQETGMQRKDYQDVMNDTVSNLHNLSITSEEALASIKALYSEMNIFSESNQQTQKELAETTSVLKRLGVQETTNVKAMNDLNKVYGLNSQKVSEATKDITKFSIVLGRDTNKVVSDLSSNMGHLARYSAPEMIKVFKEMEVIVKKTGLEMNTLLGISEGFDTFEDAAEKVGRFNTFLKGPFLNTMDLINASTPEERIRMLTDALNQSGQSFESLGRYGKIAFAEILGKNVDETSKLLGNQVTGINSVTNSLNNQAEALGEVKDMAEKNSTTDQRTKAILEEAAGITKLNDSIAKSIDYMTGWRGQIVFVLQVLQGFSAVSTLLGAGGILGSIMNLTTATQTWASSLSKTGGILARLGITGLGYGLTTLGNDDPGSAGDVFGDIAGGATIGASIGSLVPIPLVGAAIGAGIGGLIGGVSNMFASGTDSSPSGLAIVGEKGPELVSLPGNSSVINNSNTNKIVESFSNSNNSKTNVNNSGTKNITLNIKLMLDQDVLASHTKTITADYLEDNMNIVIR